MLSPLSPLAVPLLLKPRHQRGGPRGLGAGIAIRRLEQADGLVSGQARGGRGVVVDHRAVQAGRRVGLDVPRRPHQP